MADHNLRVAVCGAAGRMGREVTRAVSEAPGLTLSAAIDHAQSGADSGLLAGIGENGVIVELDLNRALLRAQPDVIVDFSLPEGLLANIQNALNLGVYPVVGATGLSATDMQEIHDLATKMHIAAFVAPNFAIGAVLMMQFAEKAAIYMPDVEIIELHHDRKLDSPSGTALLTAQRIGAARKAAGAIPQSRARWPRRKGTGSARACNDVTGDVTYSQRATAGVCSPPGGYFRRSGPGSDIAARFD